MTILRLKKDNLKISATLSSIFNSLGLNPSSTLKQIADLANTIDYNLFFVSLEVQNGLSLKLLDNPDSFYLKRILSKGVITDQDLRDYALKTLHKSRTLSVEKRILELKGIIKSFQ